MMRLFLPAEPGHTLRPAAAIFSNAHPKVHGVWETFTSEPIRPATNSISVWLRARSTGTEFPFKADFDDLALRRTRTEPPRE